MEGNIQIIFAMCLWTELTYIIMHIAYSAHSLTSKVQKPLISHCKIISLLFQPIDAYGLIFLSFFFHWNMKICINAEMNLFFVSFCLSFWYLIEICKKLVEKLKNVYWHIFPFHFSDHESCVSIIIFAWMPFISMC